MRGDPILTIRDLKKTYGTVHALDGLDMQVLEGDIYGFLGPNGSGKSTTLRIILTLVFPDAGTVRFWDKDLYKDTIWIKRKIGALIEKPDFYNYLSGRKNLELLDRVSGDHMGRKRVDEVLDWVGLADDANRRVNTFSQGMRQRLGIAQALLNDPELLILDEPANGLDPNGIIDMRNLIVRLSQDMGKTVIMSSHILKEVELISNRMIVINRGKAVIEGGVDELLNKDQKVSITVNDPEKAKSCLKDTEFGDKIQLKGEYEFQIDMNTSKTPEIIRCLVAANIDVESAVPVRSLEDYYLNIT